MIDTKKAHCIKNWMTKCSKEATSVILESLQDSPFQMGPFGETFAMMGQVFLGSTCENSNIDGGAMSPLAHEDSISVNWDLELNSTAQALLFRRVKIAFDRATAIVDDVRDKKKYRMKPEDIVTLRHLCAFYMQVREFCSTRLSDFADFDAKFTSGNAVDDQFNEIMQMRSKQFGISMLPRSQLEAASQLKRQEETATLEVEQQRLELRQAKWKYFVAALSRDQKQLSLIAAAPDKIEKLRHRKDMQWRLEQAKIGEKVVIAYSDRFVRCRQVKQVEHIHEIVHEYRAFVALRQQNGNVHV